jgi:hypothetical protein
MLGYVEISAQIVNQWFDSFNNEQIKALRESIDYTYMKLLRLIEKKHLTMINKIAEDRFKKGHSKLEAFKELCQLTGCKIGGELFMQFCVY